jgi:ribosomal protein S18 acetylase RimI-like enzyme
VRLPPKPVSLVLRDALPSDVDRAYDLSLQVIDAHIPASPFARRASGLRKGFEERFIAATSETDGGFRPGTAPFFLVAELDGQIAGLAECQMINADRSLDPVYPPTTVGYIESLGIEVELRTRGLGSALANHAHTALRDRGAVQSYLLVSHYNLGARAFWRKLGYTPVWGLYQSHWLGANENAPATVAHAAATEL